MGKRGPKKGQKKKAQKIRCGGGREIDIGRPEVNLNKTEFIQLCELQCTLLEFASWFRVDEKTIIAFCKREFDNTFSGVYKKYSGKGKISLRRSMFRAAHGYKPSKVEMPDGETVVIPGEKPNPTMLIWLSKQHLGMSDKTELEVNIKPYVIESPDGKEAIKLGVDRLSEIEGDVIDVESIEQSEQTHYDSDSMEGDSDEPTESESTG